MTSTATPGRRRTVLVVALLVVAAGIGAVLWFFADDAPDTVDIDQAAGALEGVADDTANADDGTDDGADADVAGADQDAAGDGMEDAVSDAVPDAGVDGTWTVDTSIGEFSVLDTTGTFVGFRIDEELVNIGATAAVGRTPGVEGQLVLEDGTLTAAGFTADLTEILSDEPRRNSKIQEALETDTFPTAAFALSEPVELVDLAAGTVVEVEAIGTLTVHGVEQPVTVPLQATLQDGVAVVTGSFEVAFTDFDVQVPRAPIVLSVADVGEVEFQLYLRRE